MTVLTTNLAIYDKMAASYRTSDLTAAAATLTGLSNLIRGGDGTASLTYGYGADAPIIALLPASAAIQLAAAPNTILGNIYKGFMQALATTASKAGYASLDAYLTAQNATPFTALVHPNFAAISQLYFAGAGSLLLTPGNVFAPQTQFGAATVGAGAGVTTYVDAASIPVANTVSTTAYASTQGYTPSVGLSATITTNISGTLTVTVTGNGATSAGAVVTGRTWTGVLSSLTAGATLTLTPTVAGDRIAHITAVSGSGAATAGAFTLNSVLERIVS